MGALRLIFVVNLCAGSHSSGAFYHANPTLAPFCCRLFYARAMDYIITILCLYIKWCRVFYGGLGHIIIREIDAASVGGIIVIKTYHHFVLWHRHTHTKTRRNKISLCHTISLERVTSYNLFQGCRVEICIPLLRV